MRCCRTIADGLSDRMTELDRALRAAEACAGTLPARGPASVVPAHIATARAHAARLRADLATLTALSIAAAKPARG